MKGIANSVLTKSELIVNRILIVSMLSIIYVLYGFLR